VQELASEIAVVAPKYADQIKAAQETNDPALARQIATAVATVVKAEAMQMKWQARHESLVKQREAATVDMQKAKKAQTPSGSGSVPTPPPKPKSFADMTASEADAWLRENVR
jgi:dsDNA-specific endonuclease/ATPase MutS2